MTKPSLHACPDPPLPRPPQFGMRTLLAFVTLCCVLLGLAGLLGHLWALAISWLVLMTAAHVAGNVWGTRLNRRPRQSPEEGDWPQPGDTPIVVCPAATRLQERAALGWTMVGVSIVCAVAGGALGTAALWFVGWGRIGYPSLIVGGVSAAVIGGFVGFLASSFLEVLLRAWSEALNGR
jgi:hypothetical protein